MTKIKLGFIGIGDFICKNHLLTARDSELMEIRALADIDADRLNSYGTKVQAVYTTTDYKKIINDSQIDIVIIGTKQDLHAQMIIECLQADKWTFCEKPMAETRQEIHEILKAEKKSLGKLAIGFNRRFAPAYVEAKKLMQAIERPWYIHYRLMWPVPEQYSGYYANKPHILYEGTHILDLVCWLLDSEPARVFMTGDKLHNNCCILEYPDCSQVSLMCGSMNSPALWKEYMEIFGKYNAITISDFVDMRVRGFKEQCDRLFSPHLEEHSQEVNKYGFDFYEAYHVMEEIENRKKFHPNDMFVENIKRPLELNFNIQKYKRQNPELWAFLPDKGWAHSLEHFVKCFKDGAKPLNADAKSGALATDVALALIKSLEIGSSVELELNR